jgi:hypothetical protein
MVTEDFSLCSLSFQIEDENTGQRSKKGDTRVKRASPVRPVLSVMKVRESSGFSSASGTRGRSRVGHRGKRPPGSQRKALQRKALQGTPYSRLVVWLSDSIPHRLVFQGCPQDNRVRSRDDQNVWISRPGLENKVRFPVNLSPGVTVLLVTFGGWDPVKDRGFHPAMRQSALSLLGDRGVEQVTDVWVSGGINHVRGQVNPCFPAASDLKGEQVVDGLIQTFEAAAELFPNAALRFLGSAYMPEEYSVSPGSLEKQWECNRVLRAVGSRTSEYLEDRARQATEEELQRRGPNFASGWDLFRNWKGHHTEDRYGHPSEEGCSEMVLRLYRGPSRGLLARRQLQILN